MGLEKATRTFDKFSSLMDKYFKADEMLGRIFNHEELAFASYMQSMPGDN